MVRSRDDERVEAPQVVGVGQLASRDLELDPSLGRGIGSSGGEAQGSLKERRVAALATPQLEVLTFKYTDQHR